MIIIGGAFNNFPDFFLQVYKTAVDSWKFSMLLLCSLWDDWPIFIISGANEQLQLRLEYALLMPDCHSWWIAKTIWTWGHFKRTICNEILFWTWKKCHRMLQTAFRAFCMNRASAFEWHKRFKEDRESVRDDERCGKSEHQSWLAK